MNWYKIIESKAYDLLRENSSKFDTEASVAALQEYYNAAIEVAPHDVVMEIINSGVQMQMEMADEEEKEEFDPISHFSQMAGADEDELEDIINPDDDCVLSFSKPNVKLQFLNIYSFSLPVGYTCPFAEDCLSKRDRKTKKIVQRGDKFTCFAVDAERLPAVAAQRWRNYDLLVDKNKSEMVQTIMKSLKYYQREKGRFDILRLHDAGDFFNQAYFDAWNTVARVNPGIVFYAYTKSLPYWAKRKTSLSPNFKLIASAGGKRDDLIEKEQFRQAIVVANMEEAIEKRLQIDINEFLALFGEGDFALLLHGGQAKNAIFRGRPAARLISANKKLIKSLEEKLPKRFDPVKLRGMLNTILVRSGHKTVGR